LDERYFTISIGIVAGIVAGDAALIELDLRKLEEIIYPAGYHVKYRVGYTRIALCIK